MHPIVLLENPIRHYAWGSRTFLARLQGRPFPTPEPEAELWIGAHPAAPSRVLTEDGPVPLPEWIARDPEGILGPEVAARFGGELPFLVKILAVEQPLSVQVHPDAEQARAGFEREEAAGIPRDAPHRSYRDPRPKPELVCALTPFEALVGLRPAGGVLRDLGALEIPALRPILEALEGVGGGSREEGEALGRAFAALLAWPAAERPGLVAEVAAASRCQGRPGASAALAWAARLADAWSADPLVLAPFFLHHVRLAPGETLFVAPGTLHAYLGGAAVEVQASSDNVLRAGLTGKHVDVGELLRVARVAPGAPVVGSMQLGCGPVAPEALGPGEEFRPIAVGPIAMAESGSACLPSDHAVKILVCVEGRMEILWRGARIVLRAGSGCFVPAGAEDWHLVGKGRLLGASGIW